MFHPSRFDRVDGFSDFGLVVAVASLALADSFWWTRFVVLGLSKCPLPQGLEILLYVCITFLSFFIKRESRLNFTGANFALQPMFTTLQRMFTTLQVYFSLVAIWPLNTFFGRP